MAARRPIGARDSTWARQLGPILIRFGLRPNQVSLLSVVFSTLGGACLLFWNRADAVWQCVLPLAAAAAIGLRGLCNLMDGIMAVEGGLGSKSGEIYNELPDRFSDAITLICFGYTSQWLGFEPWLGWGAAVLAVITAFVRVMGVAAGVPAQFSGPMHKTGRMALVVAGCFGLVIETALNRVPMAPAITLSILALGCGITIARRTRRIVRLLEAA